MKNIPKVEFHDKNISNYKNISIYVFALDNIEKDNRSFCKERRLNIDYNWSNLITVTSDMLCDMNEEYK